MDDVTAHVRTGCVLERGDVDQRCGAARDSRRAYDAAVEQGRDLRRRLTSARHAFEEATATADPQRRQALKDRARAVYKGEHATADRDAAKAEAAARWARAVDGINRETRIAVRDLAQAKRVVTALEAELRTADASEQSMRVSAESAEAACLEARVRLAACEERAQAPQLAVVDAPSLAMAQGALAASSAGSSPVAVATPVVARATMAPAGAPAVRPATPMPPPPPGHATQPRIGQGPPTVIEALLTGDRGWLERVASLVAETTGRGMPEVFAWLRELVDALGATSASHGYVMVDTSNEFWSRLTADESRDVLAALARLGFQVEPNEGWHADRAPVQSDLSMALAYAGLDARSLRHLPTNQDLRDLPRSIAVDTRSLLINEAPDLALDHVVRMLGHRADPLGPLWDDWGYVRPLLLGDARTLP